MAKNNFIPLVGGGTQMPASAEAVAADILRLDGAVSDLAEDVGTIENWDAGDIPYDSSENYNDGTVGGSLNDLKSAIGDLSDLDTEDKSSLVAAINEAAQSGGGGGGGTSPSPYTSNPSALGTASPGSSAKYSRGDHVHPMPSASDVGAVAVAQGASHAGEFLVVGSNGDVTTVTLSTWQGGSY